MDFYSVSKGTIKFFLNLFYKIEIKGLEYVPEQKGCIICSNHISNLDPVIIGSMLPRKISFMAKEELFRNKILGIILKKLEMIPVNRNTADISAIKNSLKHLKKDGMLGIFPEGTRYLGGEKIKAKPGLAMIAIKAKVLIIPVAITTNYRLFGKILIQIQPPVDYIHYYDEKLDVETYQELSQNVLDVIDQQIKLTADTN